MNILSELFFSSTSEAADPLASQDMEESSEYESDPEEPPGPSMYVVSFAPSH